MASNYGLNFGFRISDETRRSSFGRARTPKTGANLLIGTAVEIDPANPNYLRVAAANAKPRTGTCGLLVQEESWDRSIYETNIIDSFALGVAKKNTLSVITNGPGTKVWFRNTTSDTRVDNRTVNGVTMYVATGMAVGKGIVWNGTQWAAIADPTDPTSFGEVTYYNPTTTLLEVSLTH